MHRDVRSQPSDMAEGRDLTAILGADAPVAAAIDSPLTARKAGRQTTPKPRRHGRQRPQPGIAERITLSPTT